MERTAFLRPSEHGLGELKLSQLMAALSHALDITEGQPPGHCVRTCWIGMHIGEQIGLSAQQLWELYYTLLLKDLGCSSNAARICELYLTDDRSFKHDFKLLDGSLPQVLRFVFTHTGLRVGLIQRFSAFVNILRNGEEIANSLIETRCERGAQIARLLRFPNGVAEGIQSLDEHWNGHGKPRGLRGEEIPLYSRIALLAQVADVFYTASGPQAALREAELRAGTWFDPELVAALGRASTSGQLWQAMAQADFEQRVLALERGQYQVSLDEEYLDDIALAFGQVVDAKSPYTSGHSARVALYTDLIAQTLAMPTERRRWLRRGALLHDVGKLGVSNSVLDKPGKLDADEWAAVQMHAAYTEAILSRIENFAELARVAGAHHERLDGKGYPRGLHGDAILLETRIITTADIFDAITAERPYRAAIAVDEAMDIMAQNVGTAIDPLCFEALKSTIARQAC